MKKFKISIGISVLAFIVAMFFPSFQGMDTKNFEYKQLNYFELVKEKWWVYFLLLIVLVLTLVVSREKSKVFSIIFTTGFVILNLWSLSVQDGRLFVEGYPILWGYVVVVIFGMLTSLLLLLYAFKNTEFLGVE